MVLQQPIDRAAIQKMTEAERIQLLRQAYAEFMQLHSQIKTHSKGILAQVLHQAEEQKINQIQAAIQLLST